MSRTSLPALLLLVACGGVPDSTPLNEITDEDAADLCEEFVADFPPRTITCTVEGMSMELEIGLFESAAECTSSFEPAPATCTATVGDVRDCLQAFGDITDEEICDPGAEMTVPASCQAMFDCYES